MNTVLRKSDGAMVTRWIPDFPKGKGVLDAVNAGLGLEFDLKEIHTTDEEYMDNWYQRPTPAQVVEAKIAAKSAEIARAEAVAALIIAGELEGKAKDYIKIGG